MPLFAWVSVFALGCVRYLTARFDPHKYLALGIVGEVAPAGNFVDGAKATGAKAGACVHHTDIDTGRRNC